MKEIYFMRAEIPYPIKVTQRKQGWKDDLIVHCLSFLFTITNYITNYISMTHNLSFALLTNKLYFVGHKVKRPISKRR